MAVRKTRVIFFVLVVFLGVAITASMGSSDEKQLTIGFSQLGAESDWRNAQTDSIRQEAGKRGIILRYARPGRDAGFLAG